MTAIESEKKTIKASSEKIFAFISDFNHFKELMPKQVIGWTSTSDECSFTIEGMADINMCIKEKSPNTRLLIVSQEKTPFYFEWECLIHDINPESAEVQFILHAKLNPFLAMMAKTPLQNFLNMLVDKLSECCKE